MPSFRSAASGTGVLPSLVVSKPAGTADGDLLLAVLSFYMADGTKDVNSVPSGWTLLRTLDNFAQSNHRTSVYRKIASGEPSTWTFGTNATIAHGQAWAVIAISSPISPYITDSTGQIDPNTAPTSHPAASVNAGSTADMLVYIGAGRGPGNATMWTPPTGYTEQVEVFESANATNTIEIATKATAGATGATGTVTGTTSIGNDLECILVAVTGAGSTPVADFTGTPLSGATPLSVTFTDTSTNIPTSWLWDFGDGTTSTSQNPSHSYPAGGTYTVVMTATNATGSNTKTRTGYVTASEPIALVAGGGVTIW